MSSGHTQSPSPCARASEASAEPEGWCYFDHCTPFSEYTWLIPLLPLMDLILNGKSLLERQIPTPVMYTTPFPQHPTAPFLVTPNILEALSFIGEESEAVEKWSYLPQVQKLILVLREHPSCPLCMFFSLAFENSSSLPIGEAELGLLTQISQLAFSQGEYFQKGAHLRLGRAVVASEPP